MTAFDSPGVALVTDEPLSWHTRQLRRAFARRGFAVRALDLRKCRFDLGAGPSGLVLPGFAERLPDAVFVRGVPAGTLEQVVLRLDVLHALRELGVPVYNDARAIERSVDKAMTSFLLHKDGVPTPPTWATEDEGVARRIVMRRAARGASVVAKPLFGSQGWGLRRIEAVPGQGEEPLAQAGVAYLQDWIAPRAACFEDWRVLVAGGRALAAMGRRSSHWITNIAQGATPCAVDLDAPANADLVELSVRAARALSMDYAGVDLMRGPDGRAVVIEVNGVPAWRGLQRVTRTCLADALVDDLIDRRMGRGGAALARAEPGF